MNGVLYTNVSETEITEHLCGIIGIWLIDLKSEDLCVTFCTGEDKKAGIKNIGKPVFDLIRVDNNVRERILTEVNRSYCGSVLFVDRERSIYVLGLMPDSFNELCLIKTDKKSQTGKRTRKSGLPITVTVPFENGGLEGLNISSNDRADLESIWHSLASSSNCLCATAVKGKNGYSAFCECVSEFAKLSGANCIIEAEANGDAEPFCDRETPNYSVCDKVAKLLLMLLSGYAESSLSVKKEANAIVLTLNGRKLTDWELSVVEGYVYSGALSYCQSEVTWRDPFSFRFELYPESQYRDGVKQDTSFDRENILTDQQTN